MRRLFLTLILLTSTPVFAEDTNNPPVPIVSSISNFIVELGNIYDAIMAPSVRIPADVPKREVECLADNIYFEAKSEPYEGQLAVAQVTLNRVEHPQYPKTVCGVVWQQSKDRRSGRRVAQFSWTLDGRSDIPKSKSAYEEAYAIAEEALLYGTKSAIIGTDALFYHANYVKPRWARRMDRVAQIGNHIFYQLKI